MEGKASSGALGPRHTIVRARVGRRSKANDDGEALRELRSGVEAVEDPVDRDAGGAVPIPLRLSRLNLQPLRWSSQLTSTRAVWTLDPSSCTRSFGGLGTGGGKGTAM